MSVKDWLIEQQVTVHFPYANQGAPKSFNTIITGIGRRYITVRGVQGKFDATLDVPRSDHEELYTLKGYIEMVYTSKVLLEMQRPGMPRKFPIGLAVRLGDYLGIERPEHLQKEKQDEDEKRTGEHLNFASDPRGSKHHLR